MFKLKKSIEDSIRMSRMNSIGPWPNVSIGVLVWVSCEDSVWSCVWGIPQPPHRASVKVAVDNDLRSKLERKE